jgi:TonB-linked SusC/RagA family outer membrane protein
MKKRMYLILIVLFTSFATVMAQMKVSGTITDSDGNALPGVSVIVKGTTTGTNSDMKGSYTISVPSASSTLVFSFIGMSTTEEVVNSRSVIDVSLKSEAVGLQEVVVTALGIQRDKKTLTYASQQVSGAEIMKASDMNFMNSLSGKTAGLEIRKSASGAGGSTKTVLRGNKSIQGNVEPLYVVDGVPMINRKGDQPGMWGGWDEGDGLSQLNSDDIESISVLKGSNAAVLYGSQGANGVIIINTKKGVAGKAVVSLNSSTTFENPLVLPELQYSYGAKAGAKESWSTEKGNYPSNYVKDFFQTGVNAVNTISVSGGNDKTTAYFSYGNTSSKGIVPTNTYSKNNFTFKQSTKLFNDKVRISSNVMLASELTKNRMPAGYYLNPLTGLYFFPRERDFEAYKNEWQILNTNRNLYVQNWFVNDHHQSNPYWILNKEPREDETQRVIANITVEYNIAKGLKLQLRGSEDYSNKRNEQQHAAGSNTTNVGPNGRWYFHKFTDNLMYGDAILTYNTKFGDFSLDALAGASYQQTILDDGISVDNGVTTLFFANEFYMQNLPTNVQVNSTWGGKVIKEAFFGNIQLGWKEMLFLDLSGRNDWASTLAGTGNESYFYPSVGISAILTQMLPLPEFISFAKLRGSRTVVANEVPFNVVHPGNSITASGGVSRQTTAPFSTMKPEMLTSYEGGLDMRFFKGRLGFDFTYYNIVSTDQFMTLSAPSGSGFTNYYVNAGKVTNNGIELTITAEPIVSTDFTWNTAVNLSKNTNKIVELIPEYPDMRFDFGSSEDYATYIKAGGSYGDIYGHKFLRDDQGRIKLDENTSRPLKTEQQEYLGNSEPKMIIGWNNDFAFKNFALSFLINGKMGGIVVSQTESMLDGAGTSKRTGDARDVGYVSVNAVKGTTPVTQVDPETWYRATGDRTGILEAYIWDRTNVRLTQLALTYNLDVKKLNIPLRAASISLIGQNLFFLYRVAPFDPELVMNTGTTNNGLENFNMPTTRTYGFNVKITF